MVASEGERQVNNGMEEDASLRAAGEITTAVGFLGRDAWEELADESRGRRGGMSLFGVDWRGGVVMEMVVLTGFSGHSFGNSRVLAAMSDI